MSVSDESILTTFERMIEGRNDALYQLYLEHCEKRLVEKENIASKEEFLKYIDFMDENIKYNATTINGEVVSSVTVKDFKERYK